MNPRDSSGVIDAIYEAALIPEKWEDVVTALSRNAGTLGGVIFTQSGPDTKFITNPNSAAYFQRFVDEGWDRFNTRRERADRLNHSGFLTDLDVFETHELAAEPLYRDFLYPMGLGWSVGTHLMTADGDALAVSLDGAYVDGPVPREVVVWLDGIRPHLARALSMTARLKTTAAIQVAEGLGAFGLPSCVINFQGRMLAANGLMHPLVPSLILDRRDRVMLRHPESDQLLVRALKSLSESLVERQVMSIPVPANEEQDACVVHVIPVRNNGRDLIPGGLCILAVSIVSSLAVPDSSLLRGLFDLTPGEARVARHVANGVAPKDIDELVGTSANTVKTHLKAIYAKTGTHHYGALVRLLSGTLMLSS
ncbi:helix-turn-helix transcriptional regulator [Shinella zoogloeoides]